MDVRFRSVTYRATPNASPQDLEKLFHGLLLACEGLTPSIQAYDAGAGLIVSMDRISVSAEGLDAVLYTDQLVISGTHKHDWPIGGMPADRGDGTYSGPEEAATLPSRLVDATHASATMADGC